MGKHTKQNKLLAKTLRNAGLEPAGALWQEATGFMRRGAALSDIVKYLTKRPALRVAEPVAEYGLPERSARCAFLRPGIAAPVHGQLTWRPRGSAYECAVLLDGGSTPASEFTLSNAALRRLQHGYGVGVDLYGLDYRATRVRH